MYGLDEIIRKYDNEDIIKKAICRVVSENLTKEIAIGALADDLQLKLYDYIYESEDLDIGDGSNVRSDFTKEIRILL